MSTIANNIMTKFDVQDVVIILRTGTYLNTAGVVAMINVFENVYFKDLVDPNVSWLIIDIGDLENNVFEGDKKCECGSEKVNSNKHSSWCPKYDS